MTVLRRFRSAVTGRYTTKAAAEADPAGTVSEAAYPILPLLAAAAHLNTALSEMFDLDSDLLGENITTAWAELRTALGQ